MSFAQELRIISQEALKKSREEIVQGALGETLTQEEDLFIESYELKEQFFTACTNSLRTVANTGLLICFATLGKKDGHPMVEFNRSVHVFFRERETEAENEALFKAFRIHARNELGLSVQLQPHINKWRFSWEK